MKFGRILLAGLAATLLVAGVALGATIEKSFPAKEMVRLSTVSGDCRVEVWDKNEIGVEIIDKTRPADSWEPIFTELSRSIKMEEEHFDSNHGRISWKISVPQGTIIRFSTASGDLTVRGLKADVDVETASGDIDLFDCEGEFDISTASGDIDLENVSGLVDLSTASGDITGIGVTGLIDASTASGDIDIESAKLNEEATFRTASGDVVITLASKPTADIEVSTASGNAVLDCNGVELSGTVEMYARYRKGDISTDFDLGERQRVRRDGERWELLSGVLGNDDPLIVISTASGRAELNK